MLVEHLLDLARVHVVAAADDHVLLAVDDEEEAVLVDLAEVAGVEPAVADRLLGGVRAAEVALHDVVALDGDLADLAGGDLVVVVVDDPHLDAVDGQCRWSRPGASATLLNEATGDVSLSP